MASIKINSLSYLDAVSMMLRKNHSMRRLESEWFCFRLLAAIEMRRLERHTPRSTAKLMFEHWVTGIDCKREFDLLFSGVLLRRDEPNKTEESAVCLPMNVSSGSPEPASNGIKRKLT